MIEPFHCTFKILQSDWFIALHPCFHYYLVTFFSPSEYFMAFNSYLFDLIIILNLCLSLV